MGFRSSLLALALVIGGRAAAQNTTKTNRKPSVPQLVHRLDDIVSRCVIDDRYWTSAGTSTTNTVLQSMLIDQNSACESAVWESDHMYEKYRSRVMISLVDSGAPTIIIKGRVKCRSRALNKCRTTYELQRIKHEAKKSRDAKERYHKQLKAANRGGMSRNTMRYMRKEFKRKSSERLSKLKATKDEMDEIAKRRQQAYEWVDVTIYLYARVADAYNIQKLTQSKMAKFDLEPMGYEIEKPMPGFGIGQLVGSLEFNCIAIEDSFLR